MNAVLHKLLEEFPDEVKGANAYLDLADEAPVHGVHHGASHKLRSIARDEFTHATAIREILIASGITIPEEHQRMYCNLKERIHLVNM